MNARFVWCAAVALSAGLFAAAAGAETIYKLIDKNGKVTYSESKPKTFDGQVIRIDIDPNANTATLPKPAASGTSVEAGVRRPHASDGKAAARADSEERIRVARERVEAARKLLQETRDNPGPDDVQFIGKVGGGARPVPTQAYQDKLAQLEKAVQDAEEDLRRAEKES
jgi:hypothetical protein